MSMTRSAFFEKLNSIEIRRRLLKKELADVSFPLSQQEVEDLQESEEGLRYKVGVLAEKLIRDKDMNLLFSDTEFSHAVYTGTWNGNDSVHEKLSAFKSSLPYIEPDSGLHLYDRENNLVVNIFFVAIPHDADPMKLDELAEKLDKVFRVQREILLDSGEEVFIAINFSTRDGIYYHEDREKPYSVTGSEGEYETLRQALDVVQKIRPIKQKKTFSEFSQSA